MNQLVSRIIVGSLLLASVLLTGCTGRRAFTRLDFTPDLLDLYDTGVLDVSPRGRWLAVDGHYGPDTERSGVFLVDLDSDRAVELGAVWPTRVAFSDDGTVAAWVQFRRRSTTDNNASAPHDIYFMDLTKARPWPTRTPTSFPHDVRWLALSDDGSKIILVADGTLTVRTLNDGALLATLPRSGGEPREWRHGPSYDGSFFLEDHVRVYRKPYCSKDWCGNSRDILDLDLSSGRAEEIGRLVAVRSLIGFQPSSDGRTIIVGDSRGLYVHDGRTGDLLKTIASDFGPPSAQALADGRLAVLSHRVYADRTKPSPDWSRHAQLMILAEDSSTEKLIEIGTGNMQLGGEIKSGVLLVHAAFGYGGFYFVDVDNGAVTRLSQQLRPWSGAWRPFPPGSLATKLFVDAEGNIVHNKLNGRPSRHLFRRVPGWRPKHVRLRVDKSTLNEAVKP